MSSPARKSPVSAAIEIRIEDPQLAEAARRTLGAIDAVHDDGALRKIPLIANPRLKSALACYHYKGSKPEEIQVKPSSATSSFDLLEEIAHFLDHQALGTDGMGFASHDHPVLEGWRKAVLKSALVKTLKRRAFSGKGWPYTRLREAYSLHEIFARSYCQYIAQMSGDPILVEQLKLNRNGAFGEILHWKDEQFPPILEELEKLFTALHWK